MTSVLFIAAARAVSVVLAWLILLICLSRLADKVRAAAPPMRLSRATPSPTVPACRPVHLITALTAVLLALAALLLNGPAVFSGHVMALATRIGDVSMMAGAQAALLAAELCAVWQVAARPLVKLIIASGIVAVMMSAVMVPPSWL